MNWSNDPDRTDNDVAYNAINYPIVDGGTWLTEDGVSAGIPQWAGLVADADQARAALGKSVLAASGLNSGVYLAASDAGKLAAGKIDKAFFTDITTGSAGTSATCKAAKGWDWTTGLGTPKANGLVSELADI